LNPPAKTSELALVLGVMAERCLLDELSGRN